MEKACKKCGTVYPATRDNFGSTPSGGLRGTCRKCVREANQTPKHMAASRERTAKRQAKAERVVYSFTDRMDLHKRQSGKCLCCGKPIASLMDAEIDHMLPVARGGASDHSNLMLAHPQCNREKHAKTLEEHWAWRVRVGLDQENIGPSLRSV